MAASAVRLTLLAVLLGGAGGAAAQPLSFTLAPSALTMNLRLLTPGDSLRASNATTVATWFDRRGGPRSDKVTVSTFCPGQRFALRVEALNVQSGLATGPVALQDGNADRDLVVAIPHRRAGLATIRYDAAGAIDQGTGADYHVVTYTFIRQ